MSTQSDQTTNEPAVEVRPPATNDASATSDRPRGWRRLLLRGRSAVAAGLAAGALAIGGLGFGAGYAVAHSNTDQPDTTEQTPPFDRGEDGFGGPGDMGAPPDGQMGGPMGGQTDGGTGDSGQAPDFDGDGQPDDTSPDSSEDPTQNSAQQS